MTIGTGSAVVVPLLLAPVWGRAFPVGDFAVAALLQVIPGLVTSWAAFAFQAAIQTPEAEKDALALVVLAFALTAAVAGVVGIVLYGAGPSLVIALRNPGLTPWLWAIPVLILSNSIRLIVDQWMIRRGMMGELGLALLASTVASAGLMATGVVFPSKTNSVVLGLVGGTAFGALWRLGRSRIGAALLEHPPSCASVAIVAKRYSNFPRDVVSGSVLSNIGLQVPQVFLARHFGTDVVGQYSRAMVLVGVPASVLGQPIAATLAGEAGKAYRTAGDCRAEVAAALRSLVVTLVPAYVVLGLLSPLLIPMFLGPAWLPAGQMAQPMVASMLGSSIGGPFGVILLIANRTGTNLLWQMAWLLLSLSALGFGVKLGTPVATLWLLAVANLISYGTYAWLAYRFAQASTAGTNQR